MPLPKYVTPELVSTTADRLLSQGVPLLEITNGRIRGELGRGSMETIQPLLRDWKKRQTDSRSLDIEIPDEFRSELQELGSKLWSTAAKTAMDKASSKFADYHAIKREMGDVYRQIDDADTQLEALKANVYSLYGELTKLKEDIVRHQGELSVYRDNNDGEGCLKKTNEWLEMIEQRVSDIIEQHLEAQITAKPTVDSSAS